MTSEQTEIKNRLSKCFVLDSYEFDADKARENLRQLVRSTADSLRAGKHDAIAPALLEYLALMGVMSLVHNLPDFRSREACRTIDPILGALRAELFPEEAVSEATPKLSPMGQPLREGGRSKASPQQKGRVTPPGPAGRSRLKNVETIRRWYKFVRDKGLRNVLERPTVWVESGATRKAPLMLTGRDFQAIADYRIIRAGTLLKTGEAAASLGSKIGLDQTVEQALVKGRLKEAFLKKHLTLMLSVSLDDEEEAVS